MIDEYAQLKKIIADTINTAAITQTLNFDLFFQQMEGAFQSSGFRDDKSNDEIKSIFLLHVGAAGDFVLTTPAIRTVRENFPGAFITLVVNEKIFKLAELCPYVNEVLPFNQKPIIDPLQNIILDAAIFSAEHLWKRRFDKAICLGFVNHVSRNFLMYFSGARERCAWLFEEIDKIFITHCGLPSSKYKNHEVIINFYMLQGYGLKTGNTDIEVWFNGADLYAARRLLKNFGEGRIKIAVSIGANSPARKYPIEKYLAAFKVLVDKGAALVIFGGPSELDDAKFLENNLPEGSVKNFVEVGAGWRVDVAAMSLTDMYIGNFTGACDIAAALHKPVIALSRVARDIKNFYDRLNEAERYRPWGTDSIIIQPEHQLEECRLKPNYQGCTAKKAHCIAQIEPSEIVDAFDKMLEVLREDF